MKRILWAAADEQGCMYYRCALPAKFMSKHYLTSSKITCQFADPDLAVADVFILQRQFSPELEKPIKFLQSHGKKVLFELDDNLWKVQPQNPGYKYWNKDRLKGLNKIISLCDGVITTTEPLKEIMRTFNRNIYIVPNYIDAKQFTPKEEENDKVIIGWAGSNSHNSDFTEDIVKTLLYIKEKHGIEITLYGYCPPKLLDKVKYVPFTFDPFAYPKTVSSLKFDIGIIPCEFNYFNQCKSNLKWLEYSACKAVSVASAVNPYVKSIVHGETGMIYRNKKEFRDSIEFLLTNPQERNRISNRAYEEVLSYWAWNDYTIDKTHETYKHFTGEHLERQDTQDSNRQQDTL